MFIENGHEKSKIENIVESWRSSNSSPENNDNDLKFVKLPWIPQIGPKLRSIFKTHGYKVAFTSGPNLKSILCNNKSKLLPNSYPGVYKLTCSCGAIYIGETKKKVLTRTIEHQQDSIKGNWESSGATEHCKSCHGQFNWLHPDTLSVVPNFRERKIREALEINRARTLEEIKSCFTVINRDNGNLASSNVWKPLFSKLKSHAKRVTQSCLT